VAWTEAGVVGFTYEHGFGPIEQLGLSVSAVCGGPDDVRGAVPDLPPALSDAFEMAVGTLEKGIHGEKLASVGFWLHGGRAGGTLFSNRLLPGARRLYSWGLLRDGRLVTKGTLYATIELNAAKRARATEPPLRAIVDSVAARALSGPTELTTDELATLLPTPPDPERLLTARRRLEKVGIRWPGSPEIPEEPGPTGANS